MEQIETQVSDLRYLTQAPVQLPSERLGAAGFAPHNLPAPAHANPQSSPLSAIPGDNSAQSPGTPRNSDAASLGSALGLKRKSEEESQAARQQRSKRNRYISIACNECKRRKIKCNGETPCQRCGNLNLACLYAPNCCSNSFRDSDEFKDMGAQMTRLQDQVDSLNQSMNSLRSETLRLAPIQDANKVLPLPTAPMAQSPASSLSSLQRPELTHLKSHPFRGPTSMAFSLDVANNTIHNMGYNGIGEGEEQNVASSDDANSRPAVAAAEVATDPLWGFSQDEMVRLCRLHEEEVGIMYPVIEIQSTIDHAQGIAIYMDSNRKQGVPPVLNDDKTLLLKIVMCCALVVEEHGHSEKAIRLYDSMEAVLNRKLMAEGCDFANLPLLALVAGYRFLSNDEVLAWRVMGQVARLCLEWGIHQRTGLMRISSEEERRNALNSFWTAYMLDRRWAFGTGLPYVVQDDEIDSELPMPDEYPYLVAMISLSRLCAKVWRQVAHFGPVLARELRHQDMEQLDHEILEWYEHVPEEVKLRHWDREKQMTSASSYNVQRLRIWTYLRLNQIRIWLYTPVLHSATSIMSHFTQAQRVVQLAKDTIRYLSHLNNATNLYRKLQVFYHQFLTSAIAVLFLASVHAPVRFSSACREEFYIALDLVKDLSAKSWVSKRLWRTIGALKEVAPRIGLRQNQDDSNGNAALTINGLASGGLSTATPVPASAFGREPKTKTPSAALERDAAESLNNGTRIQSEMSRIFEDYLGVGGFAGGAGGDRGFNDPPGAALSRSSSAGVTNASFSPTQATVFQHFKDMF